RTCPKRHVTIGGGGAARQIEGAGVAADPAEHEAAAGPGRDPVEVEAEVLGRHLVVDVAGQEAHGGLHDGDGDPLAGAAVAGVEVAAALGDEVEGAAGPASEALGQELV